jgi:hypothetical protein
MVSSVATALPFNLFWVRSGSGSKRLTEALIVSAHRAQNGRFGYLRRFDRSRAIRSSISVTVSAKSSLIST